MPNKGITDTVSLAIFDLDNTLLGGDSDYLWGQFLVERGLVDRNAYEEANKRFYEDYRKGTLNIVEFLNFALRPLAANDPAKLYQWRSEFIEEKIKPILLPAARTLVEKHRRLGHTLLVITATNHFVTEPIARLYGVEHLIATVPDFKENRYTGRFSGIPCFQEGKVRRLKQWLAEKRHDLEGSWFYSDSHNDLPLLLQVEHPVAIDPDEALARIAREKNWPILSLRGTDSPCEHLPL